MKVTRLAVLLVGASVLVAVAAPSASASSDDPVAHASKKCKKKKWRKKCRRGTGPSSPTARKTTATISGHSNWSSAQVNVQHVAGSSWVNTPGGQSVSNASGNYTNTVVAGYTYRYYVSALFYLQYNFGFGPILCHQLWADASPYVTAVGGHNYSGMDTFLQPTGPIGC